MKLSTQISLGFLIAISIDLLDSFVNYTLTLRVKTDSGFLNRSETVIRNSGELNKGILTMQSAFRGYLLTDDEHFLEPYYSGLKKLPEIAADEKSIVSLPAQQKILDSIVNLHNEWISFANTTIGLKRKSIAGKAAGQSYRSLFGTQFKDRVGKSYNDRIAALFNSFDGIEYDIREERRLSLSDSIDRTDKYSLVFSILLVFAGAGIAIYLVKKISIRIGAQVKLAERISQGIFTRVEDRKKDELSGLSVSLNSMSDTLSRTITDLQKRNAELDQFAYVVSHDLKAPVRGISNVVQWIGEDHAEEISPEMRKLLDFIPDRIARLENLIDGLLQYARISRDQSVKEEVDVAALINGLIELIVPKTCKVNLGGLPVLFTERLPLQQVFSNLISNAVKYSRAENAEITISCTGRDSFYEFSVLDNGPGILPEYHEKIFVIFQTLRKKTDKESTGIGLALVKKIVGDRNGTVRVVSLDGSGSNFIFTWPKD